MVGNAGQGHIPESLPRPRWVGGSTVNTCKHTTKTTYIANWDYIHGQSTHASTRPCIIRSCIPYRDTYTQAALANRYKALWIPFETLQNGNRGYANQWYLGGIINKLQIHQCGVQMWALVMGGAFWILARRVQRWLVSAEAATFYRLHCLAVKGMRKRDKNGGDSNAESDLRPFLPMQQFHPVCDHFKST